MLFKKIDRLFSLEELLVKLLELACQALHKAEVPVLALICEPFAEDGSKAHKEEAGGIDPSQVAPSGKYKILSISCNSIRKKHDPTAHSEMLALQKACQKKKSERLRDCIMLTTLEPCLMCSGAIVLARLKSVYYLAPAHKGPGIAWILKQISKTNYSLKNMEENEAPVLNHYPYLFHLKEKEEQYKKLLRSFFKARR